jgi:murein L,D-transpeptidase YcbB/YkuD
MRFNLVYLIFFSLVVSCSRDPELNFDFLNDPSLSISTKLERYLSSDSLLRCTFNQQEINQLTSFYKDNDFTPSIALSDSTFSKRGNTLVAIAKNPLAHGVPEELCLPISDSMHPVEVELRSIINLSRICAVAKDGFFTYDSKTLKPKSLCKISVLNQLSAINNPAKQHEYIVNLGPKLDTNYVKLAREIYAYATRYSIDTTNYSTKKDSLIKNNPTKFAIQSLTQKGYLTGRYSIKNFEDALLTFKTHNGLDSTLDINDYTIEALAESNKHRLTRAAISLDKVRQHAAYGPRYVRINIPEYQLYFFANDSLKAIHRVVVGKRNTQTPELVSEIRTIIIYPYWKVPASIIKKEIMPDVYKNQGYLARHHYKLCRYNDTTRIDPKTINWGNRPSGFNVIQMPGPWNSLGVIKFEFLNNHSVYVHDTPQKSFFNRKVRSYSHGCMRCQNPIDLGKLMLDYDQEGRRKRSMPADTLDSLIRIGDHTAIALKNRIPIYVEYQTVTMQYKRLTFHIDIYFRDEELIGILTSTRKKSLNNRSK